MSFRELRNFTEMMRSLGYPRIISMENFRIPNFKLVAEILFWLIKRFDPKADIPDVIEEERDRVEFIKSACQFFYIHLKIKINPKKVYSSDGYSIQEIIKVAEILYKAKKSMNAKDDYEFSTELDISSKKQDINQIKILSSEIVETGLNLLDLLDKEKQLKEAREKAIEFLDNLSKNTDSKKEQEQIEKRIISILQNQQNTLEQLDEHLGSLRQRYGELDEEIKLKQVELERSEKRLESLNNARPAHLIELRQLEAELSHYYRIYVEKIRNHDYLSAQLEKYHKIEDENKVKRDRIFKDIQNKIRMFDEKVLNDENEELNAEFDNNDGYFENYQNNALNKNSNNFRTGTSNPNAKIQYSKAELDGGDELEGEQEEEEQEESDNGSNF